MSIRITALIAVVKLIIKVSQKQKVIVDYGLAALGAFIGNLVGAGVIGAVAGAFGGFFVSDLATYIDTGKVPTQDIENQVVSLVNMELQKQKTSTLTTSTTPSSAPSSTGTDSKKA